MASYSIHLKQCVTLYLFTLPFTLVRDLGLLMPPIVTIVSFTLMVRTTQPARISNLPFDSFLFGGL
ncbi:hypothetical protein FRC20_009954 [Serendipita sp. 405]|nr:hypothetical protein FRC20_009954 [Serendipita sp. 405]